MGKRSANIGEACRTCHAPFPSRHCLGCTSNGHRILFCPTCAWASGEPNKPAATRRDLQPRSSTRHVFALPTQSTVPNSDQSWTNRAEEDTADAGGSQQIADQDSTAPPLPSTDEPMGQATGGMQSQYTDVQLPDGTACCTRCNWRGITKTATCLACMNGTVPAPGQVVTVDIATAWLPTVGRFPTIVWIPRRVKPAAAQILCRQLHVAATTANLPHSASTAAPHHLLYHLPQLLFRRASNDDEELMNSDDPDKPTPFKEVLEARLEKAARGDWPSLVQELWDDIAEYDTKPSRPSRANALAQPSNYDDDAPRLDQATLESCRQSARRRPSECSQHAIRRTTRPTLNGGEQAGSESSSEQHH